MELSFIIVNSKHILSLKQSKTNNVVDIDVKDFVNSPKSLKNNLLGYQVPVDFSKKISEIKLFF